MNFLEDFKYINNQAIPKAIKSIKDNWMIIFTGIVYSIISMLVATVTATIFRGPLYIISGFINYFIQATIISNYLYLLMNVINYNKFSLDDFKAGFSYYLWKVYGVLFIFYIANLMLSLAGNIFGAAAYILNLLIYIGALVVFNPLPETIYLKSYSPADTVMYCLEFIKENWLNWYLPNILLMILLYLLSGQILTGFINTSAGFIYSLNIADIVRYLVAQLIFSFMMIYRGHLYKILSTSTRRKRMFMNRF